MRLLYAVALVAPQSLACGTTTTTVIGNDQDHDGIDDAEDGDDDNDGIPDGQDDDHGDGSGDGDGAGDGDGDGAGDGDGDGGDKPEAPPVDCAGAAEDADASALDFANNQIASPAPPGNLSPENAPQIVVFGWDDVESVEGITFVNELLGSITNPDGSKASTNLNPNSCYIRGWGGGGYGCGMGDLAQSRSLVTQQGFSIGNHTVDHLESNSMWEGIPEQYKDPETGSWKQTEDWYGPGVYMDQSAWTDVLMANEGELRELLTGVTDILGFRAPRLEINDHGLKALRAMNYEYDMTLEELLPETYVEALASADTAGQKGFNFVPWPYTLDNGSSGVWLQQLWGDKKYVQDYPRGLWEVPVYMLYVPKEGGLGKTIANTMMASDHACTFPAEVPEDEREHCFLSDGELNPGDEVKEITAFDFNTFVYARLTAEQWLEIMKHTFLTRFHGNRAPLTYGAHPIEYTPVYDSFTIQMQANNYGYRDVLNFNTAASRKQAMKDFVAWVKNDPSLSAQTYFMSAQQMVEYMKKPFDKDGNPVSSAEPSGPASNGVFSRLGWSGDATVAVDDGNSADITFTVSDVEAEPVRAAAGLNEGSLRGVSHIDVKYETDVPFRIRLLTSAGVPSTTVLLAGTGSERVARIRVQDFFPGSETSSSDLANAKLVDADYMAKVNGIAFESAATGVTGAGTFHARIEQITLHGVETSALCD